MQVTRQHSLFQDSRLSLKGAIELSLASLNEYGQRYEHWATAYSGGKDSSATTTFIAWAIREGLVPRPKTWTVLYADTRQELPPLDFAATSLIDRINRDGMTGVTAKKVLPPMDDRFYVYMFGRGVPPPKNRFRWCTPQLKIYPMQFALEDMAAERGMGRVLRDDELYFENEPWLTVPYQSVSDLPPALFERAQDGTLRRYTAKNRYGRQYQGNGRDKLLMLTGVRQGESAARDQRIAVSCSKDSGECGQGWFQVATPESLADTLAPLLHWRLCHIYDWLYFEQPRHGYPEVIEIADVYGGDDVRTGCVGCNLASRDTALERLLSHHADKWGYLHPLMELKPLFRELTKAKWRKRKSGAEIRQDGTPAKNIQRLGPLTMDGRKFGMTTILDIQGRVNRAAQEQGRPEISLINGEEKARIEELWGNNTWPNGWSGDEIAGDVPVDALTVVGSDIVTQPLLV